MALINWPFDLKEKNPIKCMPPAHRDSTYGFYMMRNRWQDENDVLVQVPTASTRGWHKFTSRGEVYVWALGKKRTWGNLRMPVTHWRQAKDGSAIIAVRDGTCLAVDYSRAAGVDAMVVMTGPGASKGDAAVELGENTLHFLFLTDGEKPKPTVRGDAVVVGKQSIAFKDGRIVLSEMAGPWEKNER